MSAPSTQYQLEFIRPDFLLIRTVAKGLIMWSDIVPTAQWVEGHVPQSFLRYCMVREIIYLVVRVPDEKKSAFTAAHNFGIGVIPLGWRLVISTLEVRMASALILCTSTVSNYCVDVMSMQKPYK